ncbi:MAG: ABC transporter ATP-binding protein [Bacteroidales bacterium]|jgi:peptide/nickel transport system ATP-binding protein|nr:ABC transporter ATP-binding protein [Bacteroidales bacterium]
MEKQAPPILNIENLKIGFDAANEDLCAVDGISFQIKTNQIVGVVGESGSGKSITALSVLRLLNEPPAHYPHGIISLMDGENEVDILAMSKTKMNSIRGKVASVIFQEPMTSLNPSMRCGKQVVEAIMAHQNISKKEAYKKTIELFDEVALPRAEKIFKSYPHEISGGQKQRVMIAMALSSNPSLLIADEPTTALDVTVQKTILNLLKELKDKYSMSILFITHDLGVVSDIADEIIVMYKGEIVERGRTKDVFHNPQHSYTKGLLHCRPSLNTRPRRLATISDFMNFKDVLEVESFEDERDRRAKQHKEIYSQEPILRVKSISKEYALSRTILGKPKEVLRAVNNLSFEIYKGETLGLVGESGCGKTTLGRTLMRLIEPDGGEIFYKGQNITSLKSSDLKKFRKTVQIIFQDPYSSLNPRIPIGEAIMEPMKIHNVFSTYKERREYAIYLLERVSLGEEHFDRYPHEFSGGQRQRVCIARALSLKPELIICDESVSALDVSVQAQVLNLLNDLKEDFGLTYIFISHDLSVVKYMSDRMMVMKDGNIVEFDEADAIYANPKTEYTKNLIGSIPGA